MTKKGGYNVKNGSSEKAQTRWSKHTIFLQSRKYASIFRSVINQCQIATLLEHLANLYALSSNYIFIYSPPVSEASWGAYQTFTGLWVSY